MSELYHVVALRRMQAGQAQLNFTSAAAAKDAYEKLVALPRGLERLAIADDFGATVCFDPNDIGHIMLINAAGSLEMQATASLMQARAQAEAQAKANRDPTITRGGLVIPQRVGEFQPQ